MANEKLINRLRDVPCWDIGTEAEETMLDAACALEAVEVYEKAWKQKCERLEKRIEEQQKRIAELEAQMPKRGEWIMCESEKPYIVCKCSVCGGLTSEGGHFCPNCGAKMKGEQE